MTAKEISVLLTDSVKRTVDNTGDWSFTNPDVKVWIGSPEDSRTNNYECQILRIGRSIEMQAKTFPALIQKIIKFGD